MPALRSTAAALLLAAAALPALADTPPAAPAPDDAALAGPKVADRPVDDSTIVQRNAMGTLIRHERDPALEALDKLKLDTETRAKADEIIAKRYTVLDNVVQDNLLLLNELNNARLAGNRDESRRLLRELYAKAKPYLDRGSLADELKPVLTADQHARLVKMVEEYQRAAVKDRIGAMGDDGEPMTQAKADITERLTQLGIEVRRSYERRVQSGGREFDKFLADLNVTPEQEAKIRQRVQAAYFDAQGKPGKAQIAKVFLESWQDLSTEQRQQLMKILRERRQAEAKK